MGLYLKEKRRHGTSFAGREIAVNRCLRTNVDMAAKRPSPIPGNERTEVQDSEKSPPPKQGKEKKKKRKRVPQTRKKGRIDSDQNP